jgi:uncharacterized protein involved in exopolysaccharide biosynthesis
MSSRQAQIADILRRKSEVDQFVGQAEKDLAAERAALQELEDQLQTHRQNYKNLSMHRAEIEEAIKELRPLSEACQE